MLNTADSEKLASHGLKLRTRNRTLFPCNSPPLKITQCLVANVQFHDGPSVSTEFLILPGSQSSLFGRDTAESLQILKIVNQVCTPSPLVSKNPYLDKYPGLCAGTGKLKNQPVKLHIDNSVPPVVRKNSRIPFQLQDKVEKDLQRLEREDVIEKVTGQTEWILCIVIQPKPKYPSEIRLYVDMRDANKAIRRTKHVTPTIEKLVSDLSRSTVVSKIGLCSG